MQVACMTQCKQPTNIVTICDLSKTTFCDKSHFQYRIFLNVPGIRRKDCTGCYRPGSCSYSQSIASFIFRMPRMSLDPVE